MKFYGLLIIFAIFAVGITISSVSAIDDSNLTDDLSIIDESSSIDSLNSIENSNPIESLNKNDESNSADYSSISQICPPQALSLDLNSKENVLSSSVSVSSNNNGYTYHMNGYTFTVSSNQYKHIKNAIKMGKKHDWLDDGFSFKVKTNKFYTYKKPIYKTKKVTKYKWKYKKLSVSQVKYWDWEYKYHTDKKTNGWICYKLMETDFDYGVPHKHYVYLKKKVKYKTTKKVKTGNYKKVKMRVYAVVKYQGWSEYYDGPHYYFPWVDFKAIKSGYSTKYLSMSFIK